MVLVRRPKLVVVHNRIVKKKTRPKVPKKVVNKKKRKR